MQRCHVKWCTSIRHLEAWHILKQSRVFNCINQVPDILTRIIMCPARWIISPTCINFLTAATKGDQHSQSNNCCNQACCFLGLYNGLTGFAYGLIWHGVAWWIMLAVTASRPGKCTFSVLCIMHHNKVSSTYMCTCPDPLLHSKQDISAFAAPSSAVGYQLSWKYIVWWYYASVASHMLSNIYIKMHSLMYLLFQAWCPLTWKKTSR